MRPAGVPVLWVCRWKRATNRTAFATRRALRDNAVHMRHIDQQQSFDLPGYIQPGDVAPWWRQGRYKFAFDPAGGHYIVLGFYGTARDAVGLDALRAVIDNHHLADASKARVFCVSSDPSDAKELGADARFARLSFMWDTDKTVHRAYGVVSRTWIVLDPMLRVIEVIPFNLDGTHITALASLLERLPPPSLYLGNQASVPVLTLPNVFEPAFCQHLINCYEAHGGAESGFMQEIGGKAVEVLDGAWKRRKDFLISDPALIELIKSRMARRLGTMLQRVFQFKFSRIERYLVACYAAEDGGHFGPHRDDTVRGTEHRKFAVSINLNNDFDGGGVSFPEFTDQEFRVPTGGALIFSASLLHRVARVTRGRRYAFLPFVYDEESERIRVASLRFLAHQAPPLTPRSDA
jgi:predicted 2-oxoglutarate/Fe(II)-dependent dioxygenase YbiX